MISLSIKSLTAIALCLTSSNVFAAPIDGLTKRAPKVVGLDFEKVTIETNSTSPGLSKRSEVANSPLLNEQNYYITYLELGSDHTKIGVDIDTGSSDLWVPGPGTSGSITNYGTFDPSHSSTSKDTGTQFVIHYGDHSSSTGEFYTDSVSLGDGSAPLSDFQFAVVSQSSVPQGGILGIGLNSLEANTVYNGAPSYPNFPVALKNAGYIDKIAYSLYLNSPTATTGSLLFGGKDLAKIDGELVKLPHSGPANRLDVTLNSVTVNGHSYNIDAPYNLDSGSTITYLPPLVVNEIASQLGTHGFTIANYPVVNCGASGTISYDFDGISIDVPVEDLLLNFGFGFCALRILPSTTNAILGDTFLRYAYVVYDLEDSSISLGKPNYTTDTNIVAL